MRGRGFQKNRVGVVGAVIGRRVACVGHFAEMCNGSEAGPHLRLIDSFITQLNARGLSRTYNESKEEEEECHVQSSRVLSTRFRMNWKI